MTSQPNHCQADTATSMKQLLIIYSGRVNECPSPTKRLNLCSCKGDETNTSQTKGRTIAKELFLAAFASLLLFNCKAIAQVSPSIHKTCSTAKDYKGCVEAQSPKPAAFNRSAAYEACLDSVYKRLAHIPNAAPYIPKICNQSVELQSQGMGEKSAQTTAMANLVSELQQQQQQRTEQFNRDLINSPNPYAPYIWGR